MCGHIEFCTELFFNSFSSSFLVIGKKGGISSLAFFAYDGTICGLQALFVISSIKPYFEVKELFKQKPFYKALFLFLCIYSCIIFFVFI